MKKKGLMGYLADSSFYPYPRGGRKYHLMNVCGSLCGLPLLITDGANAWDDIAPILKCKRCVKALAKETP